MSRVREQDGIAMVMALGLMAVFSILAVSVMTIADGNRARDRRDAATDLSYQAAEAGTDAYVAYLTENPTFYYLDIAKGEATRTDSNNVAHAGSTTQNTAWTSGSTWTYATPATTDTGWLTLSDGYQYLIRVYPANASLSGLAAQLTRLDVTGRPQNSTDTTTWRTLETMLRPSALTDFQAFTATSLSYASTATTTGPIFVGHDSRGNPGTLTHDGIAKANLYSEGTVTGATTYQNGAKKYDSNTTPTAICKLNNCNTIDFSQFENYFPKVKAAAENGGLEFGTTDPGNSSLSSQGYVVDAWNLAFQSNGTVLVSSCKKATWSTRRGSGVYEVYQSTTPPTCGNQQTYTVPANGAIYALADVIVSGVVKGKVTVGTTADGIYGGETTYNQNGVDVLGVMATGTLYVATWARQSTLDIWSAMFAQNGPLTQDPGYNSGATGTLNLNASIAVYGQSGGSAIVMSGLFARRNYNYDNNLLYVQPPLWPTLGNAYDILVQREI